MSERDGYGPDVPVPRRGRRPERLLCRVTAAPPDLGRTAFTVSRRLIASQGA
jgi:hypothetical protein